MSEIDNNVAALAADSHNLGEFKTVYDAMKKFPTGGVSGDYITILGVQHFWNVNRMSWGILKDKEDNIVQMVEDMVGNFTKNGYILVGVATPETVPVNVPNAFYIAVVPGEYAKFGITLEEHHVYFLKKTSSGWLPEDTGIINQPLVEITHKKGDSETKVMSQKSVTGLLSEGYLFVGVATPETIPSKVDGRVFYMASEKGIYTGFDGFELDGSVLYVFKNIDGVWTPEKTNIPIDPELVVSNAEKDAREAKELAAEAKELAESAKSESSEAKKESSNAKDIADSSLLKSSNNEKVIVETSEKTEDLSKALTDTAQKSTEALGLARGAVKTSDRGVPGGIPILDGSGKIPQSQLPLTKTELVDSYESDSLDKAPTAAALHRAFVLHSEDMTSINDRLDAMMDFVSESTELGISPTQINVTSEAQSVRVQVVCNGEWTVNNIPDGLTVTPLRGMGRGTFTIGFPANDSTVDDITGTLMVANSFGKEKIINYTQYSASTRYVYELTVNPETLDVEAIAGSGSFDVVSTKTPYINDSPTGDSEIVPYTLSIPESLTWIRLLSSRSVEQYEYDENLLEASRSTVITVVQEGANGKTVEIPFNQAKATTYTEFKFVMSPTNVNIVDNGAGGTYPAKITSTKTVTINGKSETTEVPFTVTYEGGATSSWVTHDNEAGIITLPINNNETDRTGAIVFTQDGVEANVIRVNVTQAAATIAWNYTFIITPSSLRFGNAAGSRNYEVTKCVKKKTINGVEVGDEIQVAWDVSLSSDVFVLNKETSTVTAPENISEQRTAELIFTRPELGSDDKKIVSIEQDAGVVTWTYTLEASANPTSIPALNGTTILNVVSTKQKYVNGIASGEPLTVGWHGTSTNGYLSGADESGATWIMQENSTESSRVDNIIINQLEEGGKSKTLNFTQIAGTVTYDYNFSVSPTSLSFGRMGGSQLVSVTSNKQKKINGKNSGGLITVAYSSSASGNASVSGTSISMGENTTTSVRYGSITFTQGEGSGKSGTVSCSQEAGTSRTEYTLMCNSIPANYVPVNTYAVNIRNKSADVYFAMKVDTYMNNTVTDTTTTGLNSLSIETPGKPNWIDFTVNNPTKITATRTYQVSVGNSYSPRCIGVYNGNSVVGMPTFEV